MILILTIHLSILSIICPKAISNIFLHYLQRYPDSDTHFPVHYTGRRDHLVFQKGNYSIFECYNFEIFAF